MIHGCETFPLANQEESELFVGEQKSLISSVSQSRIVNFALLLGYILRNTCFLGEDLMKKICKPNKLQINIRKQ